MQKNMQSSPRCAIIALARALIVVMTLSGVGGVAITTANTVDSSPTTSTTELWVPAEEGALAVAVQRAASIAGPVTLNLQAGRHRLRAPLKLTRFVCNSKRHIATEAIPLTPLPSALPPCLHARIGPLISCRNHQLCHQHGQHSHHDPGRHQCMY